MSNHKNKKQLSQGLQKIIKVVFKRIHFQDVSLRIHYPVQREFCISIFQLHVELLLHTSTYLKCVQSVMYIYLHLFEYFGTVLDFPYSYHFFVNYEAYRYSGHWPRYSFLQLLKGNVRHS